jgi:predicted AlkP superfamily phosphohydrolase/phosphomutase
MNKARPFGGVILFALLAALVAAGSGCGSKEKGGDIGIEAEPLRKIILVGVDGADWLIINPLLEKGRLPNFQKVIDGGASGPLRSLEPMLSPLIWTTMATGKLPEVHGILNFTEVDPATGNKIPVTRLSRKVDAYWNMMSDYDRTVDVIGWLATFPAEWINGAMVTDRVGYLAFAAPDESGALPKGAVSPPERTQEIEDLLVKSEEITFEEFEHIVHIDQETFDTNKALPFDPTNLINDAILIYATAQSYRHISLHLLDEDQPNFLGVYFELVDAYGHLFMPYAPPRQPDISEDDYRKYKDAIDEIYVYQDEIIGEFIERMDDNTVMIIVSDHGFKSGDARLKASAEIWGGHAAHWHRIEGIICLYGNGIKPGYKIQGAGMINVTPTILALAGFPKVQDMPGEALTQAFEPPLVEALNPTTVATLQREREEEVDEELLGGGLDEEQMKKLEALGYLTTENPDGYNNLGQRYQKEGKFEEAIIEYKKALTIRPQFASALNNIAICYGNLKQYDKAEENFKKALAFNPEDVFAMNNLAVMYLQTKRLDEARSYAEKAIGIEPKYANAHVTLGSVYATMGKFDMAEQEFNTVLKIDPGNRSAQSNLEKVRQQKKERR